MAAAPPPWWQWPFIPLLCEADVGGNVARPIADVKVEIDAAYGLARQRGDWVYAEVAVGQHLVEVQRIAASRVTAAREVRWEGAAASFHAFSPYALLRVTLWSTDAVPLPHTPEQAQNQRRPLGEVLLPLRLLADGATHTMLAFLRPCGAEAGEAGMRAITAATDAEATRHHMRRHGRARALLAAALPLASIAPGTRATHPDLVAAGEAAGDGGTADAAEHDEGGDSESAWSADAASDVGEVMEEPIASGDPSNGEEMRAATALRLLADSDSSPHVHHTRGMSWADVRVSLPPSPMAAASALAVTAGVGPEPHPHVHVSQEWLLHDYGLGMLCIRVHATPHPHAEFWSHWTIAEAPAKPHFSEPYSAAALTRNCVDLAGEIMPSLLAGLEWLVSAFRWTAPVRSMAVLLVSWLSLRWPWLAPVLMHLALLRHLMRALLHVRLAQADASAAITLLPSAPAALPAITSSHVTIANDDPRAAAATGTGGDGTATRHPAARASPAAVMAWRRLVSKGHDRWHTWTGQVLASHWLLSVCDAGYMFASALLTVLRDTRSSNASFLPHAAARREARSSLRERLGLHTSSSATERAARDHLVARDGHLVALSREAVNLSCGTRDVTEGVTPLPAAPPASPFTVITAEVGAGAARRSIAVSVGASKVCVSLQQRSVVHYPDRQAVAAIGSDGLASPTSTLTSMDATPPDAAPSKRRKRMAARLHSWAASIVGAVTHPRQAMRRWSAGNDDEVMAPAGVHPTGAVAVPVATHVLVDGRTGLRTAPRPLPPAHRPAAGTSASNMQRIARIGVTFTSIIDMVVPTRTHTVMQRVQQGLGQATRIIRTIKRAFSFEHEGVSLVVTACVIASLLLHLLVPGHYIAVAVITILLAVNTRVATYVRKVLSGVSSIAVHRLGPHSACPSTALVTGGATEQAWLQRRRSKVLAAHDIALEAVVRS